MFNSRGRNLKTFLHPDLTLNPYLKLSANQKSEFKLSDWLRVVRYGFKVRSGCKNVFKFRPQVQSPCKMGQTETPTDQTPGNCAASVSQAGRIWRQEMISLQGKIYSWARNQTTLTWPGLCVISHCYTQSPIVLCPPPLYSS